MYPLPNQNRYINRVKWCVRQIDEQTASNLVGNLLHGLDAGAIEVVSLHLFHAGDKSAVFPVYFSLTKLTCRVCREGSLGFKDQTGILLFRQVLLFYSPTSNPASFRLQTSLIPNSTLFPGQRQMVCNFHIRDARISANSCTSMSFKSSLRGPRMITR